MLNVASACTPRCMLLDVVACCCAKFETGQTFQPTTPNISFLRDRRSVAQQCWNAFAQLFQHWLGHARSLRVVYKDLWVVSFPRCTAGPNIVGSCCIRLHTTANMNATTANTVAPTMLGVVASVCTQSNGDEVYNTVNWIQISCRHCRGCSSTSSDNVLSALHNRWYREGKWTLKLCTSGPIHFQHVLVWLSHLLEGVVYCNYCF